MSTIAEMQKIGYYLHVTARGDVERRKGGRGGLW